MARGLDSFLLDCRDEEELELIEAEFGLVGFAIVVKLRQRIYGGEGYYCKWDDRVALLFSRKECDGSSAVQEVVAACLREGIFHKGMFEKYGILTSKRIQEKFVLGAKRRLQIFDKPEYTLLCCDNFSENADISGENVYNSSGNVYISETSKVKQSKANEVKRSKAKQSTERSAPPAAQNSLYDELIGKYGTAKVAEYEKRFEAWKQKHGSVRADKYRCIAKWLLQDNVPAKNFENSSIDIDEVIQSVMDSYRED